MSHPDIALLRQNTNNTFPHLWPVVDLALATCATLLLKDNSNPAAIVLIGPPSSGKTTVLEMFADHPLTYLSDSFTPASFVSHAANVTRKDLESVDLLPRIKHKVLVTPELASTFRGKDDELTKRFSILTRVLDGQGLMTDSGTHGRRGYRGDYLFAWLGATTPFGGKVWDLMAQLGSRLQFYRLPDGRRTTIQELLEARDDIPYSQKMDFCKQHVHWFLNQLLSHWGGVRQVVWKPAESEKEIEVWIARLALLQVCLRSPANLTETEQVAGTEWESPHRAHAYLYNLARGHALVHGRTVLTLEDLPLLGKVVLSSIPSQPSMILEGLIGNGGSLTVAQVQTLLGVKCPQTARSALQDLHRYNVTEFIEEGVGKTATLRFNSDWSWLGNPHPGLTLLGMDLPTTEAAPNQAAPFTTQPLIDSLTIPIPWDVEVGV